MLSRLPSTLFAEVHHYDLADDFSIAAGNPSEVWTYGFVSAEGVFAPFTSPELAPDDNGLLVELWANDTRSAIFHNQNDQTAISYGGEGVRDLMQGTFCVNRAALPFRRQCGKKIRSARNLIVCANSCVCHFERPQDYSTRFLSSRAQSED